MTDELTALLDIDSEVTRARKKALVIKDLDDVELPRLALWNYEACPHHETPDVYCQYRLCGGEPWQHQRVGISWLYFARNGLLADETGLGKSGQVVGLLALMKERGELDRAVIICQPSAVETTWLRDFRRFGPGLRVRPVLGTPRERVRAYAHASDVLVLGFPTLIRDYDLIRKQPLTVLVSDDVQPLLHPETKTSRAFNALARNVDRVVSINATPLNLRLQDLYALVAPMGGREVFGSLRQFEHRYVRFEEAVERGPSGRRVRITREVGYQNMTEFKELVHPFMLRRKYTDVHDVRIPDVLPAQDVWLDLYPAQRERYKELQDGILRLRRDGDADKLSRVEVLQRFGYGQQVCAGLQNLGEADKPGVTSVKLDWLCDKVLGDWSEEKVVVFSMYKGTIRALRDRMTAAGVGVALIWGDTKGDSKQKAKVRKAEEERFWTDPRCRIAVGTTAIERSLNLQNARIVVSYDLLLNPQRMIQILGRVRRAGSLHDHVLPVTLLTKATQEERYLDILERRAALADYVLDDTNALFQQLPTEQLLALIQP